MVTADVKQDYTSIGTLAGSLGTTTQRIERVAQQINMAPALRLNRVEYFDAAQCEALAKALSRSKA